MLSNMTPGRTGGGPHNPLGWALSHVRNDSISRRFRRLGLKIVSEALAKTASREDAARRLGVGLRTLYRWLDRYPELHDVAQDSVIADVMPTGTDGDD